MPTRPPVLGQQLVNDFQTAMVSIATSQAAQFEAQRSENELVQYLRSMSSGYYLQPGALPNDAQTAATHASLDAHIKKVQAEQIQQLNAEQMNALWTRTKHDFLNRKVRITVTSTGNNPIESVWFDPRSGYRTGVLKSKVVSGVVQDILLDKNALVLRPIGMTHLFNQALQNYIVYIIDPNTFQPTVTLDVM